jgi:hypothetical protein
MTFHVTRVASLALIVSILGTLAAVAPSLAQQSQAPRLRGQITRIDGDKLDIKTGDGKHVTVMLAPDARVTSVVPARLAEIKPGRFVGTAARPEPNNRWRAIEVHIFPPGSRLGEGHRPWDPEPGATMTNADVAAAVVHAGNGAMTLTTGGQSYEIDVPRGTPIVAMNPGTRALVKKGALVSINQAQPGADGSYAANAITVTTVKNWPPK